MYAYVEHRKNEQRYVIAHLLAWFSHAQNQINLLSQVSHMSGFLTWEKSLLFGCPQTEQMPATREFRTKKSLTIGIRLQRFFRLRPTKTFSSWRSDSTGSHFGTWKATAVGNGHPKTNYHLHQNVFLVPCS